MKQKKIRVNHRIGKVTLDVGHSLSPNLEAVSYPHLAHNFVKRHLNKENLIRYPSNSVFIDESETLTDMD